MAGLSLILLYFIIDMKKFKKIFAPLKFMGMNAIMIFIFAADDIGEVVADIVMY